MADIAGRISSLHFQLFVLFACLFSVCFFFLQGAPTMEYDRILIFKEPLSNKALEGHLKRTEKLSDEESCRLKCHLEPACLSVNVGLIDKGTLFVS